MYEFVYEIAPVLSFLAAIAAAVLAFIFIIPDKKRAKLNKFGKFLHDLCNFKFLIIEKILQFCYVLATAFVLIQGFFMLFAVEEHYNYSYYSDYSYTTTEWVGYYGLLVMVLGPIAVRLAYEVFMLALIAVKNIIQINNKLKNQNDDAADANPFATPDVKEYIAPAAPVAPVVENTFCPYCGTPKKPDEFCSNCGQK